MPTLPVPKVTRVDGKLLLHAPGVGLWRDAPPPGSLLGPGKPLGRLEVLGVLHPLTVPTGARGLVMPDLGPKLARRPVAFGDVLLMLDPDVGGTTAEQADAVATTNEVGGLRFVSPSGGRYYIRPAPNKPPFMQPGDVIETGQTVGLLEVMKTFTRIHYGGPGLPERAKVIRVVPSDQDDLSAGDAILELEPA